MSSIDTITASITTIVFIVFVYYTRKTPTFKQFAVSNNSVGLFFISCSFAATFIGPGFSMALVREGFSNGLFYLFIAGFYGLAKIFEGTVVAGALRKKFDDALSIGDIIAGPRSGNNKLLRVFVGIMSFSLVVGFGTVLAKAGGEILNNFFGLPLVTGIIITISVVVVYSFFGGIKATILTDVFQLFLFVGIIVILLINILQTGKVDSTTFHNETIYLTKTAFEKNSMLSIIGLIITWFFGEMLIPPTINRILASKNSGVAKKGLIYSGIFMIIWLGVMLILGIFSKLELEINSSDRVLLILGKDFLHFGFYGIFTIAIIGIVMSSLDSLINSASVIVTRDIISVFKNLSDSGSLIIAKSSTIIVGISSIIFATYLPSILAGLLFVYSLWAPAMLIPLFTSVYLKNNYWQATFASMIFGITGSLIFQFKLISISIPPILSGILFSIFGYLIIASIYKTKNV